MKTMCKGVSACCPPAAEPTVTPCVSRPVLVDGIKSAENEMQNILRQYKT